MIIKEVEWSEMERKKRRERSGEREREGGVRERERWWSELVRERGRL